MGLPDYLDPNAFKAAPLTPPFGELTGAKNDAGKASRPELLPVEALTEVSKVLAFGATKYSENNWRGGFKWTRVLGATLRHLFAWAAGEDKDPETGYSHLAHAGCNILFLLTFEVTGTGVDDRHRTNLLNQANR